MALILGWRSNPVPHEEDPDLFGLGSRELDVHTSPSGALLDEHGFTQGADDFTHDVDSFFSQKESEIDGVWWGSWVSSVESLSRSGFAVSGGWLAEPDNVRP